jgi:hypothetical protein
MDTKLKYVRTKHDGIIIFNIVTNHSNFKHLEPVSAGFCYVHENMVSCFDKSVTLNIASDRLGDSKAATLQLFGYDAMSKIITCESCDNESFSELCGKLMCGIQNRTIHDKHAPLICEYHKPKNNDK